MRWRCDGAAVESARTAADLRAAMMRRGAEEKKRGEGQIKEKGGGVEGKAVGGPHEWEGGGDAGVGDSGDCGTACRAQACFCLASRSRISVRSSTSVGSAEASGSDFFMRSLNLFMGRTMQK